MPVKTKTKPIETKQETEEIIDLEDIKVEPIVEPEAKLDEFKPLSGKAEPTKPPAKVFKSEKGEEAFWAWVKSLNNTDWTYLKFYLYRLWPVIDRTRPNPNAAVNIDKFMSIFDKEYILREHGSGDYRIMVTDDRNSYKGRGNQICDAYFKIRDHDYPPKIILEELILDDKDNRGYIDKLKAEGKITNDGRVMNQGGTDQSAVNALTDLVKLLIARQNQPQARDQGQEATATMFSKAMDSALDVVKQQSKGDDPEKLVKLLATLQTMLASNKPDNMLEVVMKMQSDMAKVQMEAQASRESMMMKMMELVNAPKPTTEDADDKAIDRILKIKELFADSGGGSHKKTTLETVIEYGAPIGLKVLDLIGNVLTMQNFKAGLAKQQPNPIQVEPAAIQAPNDKVVEMPKQEENQFSATLKQYGGMIIGALQRGQTGSDFASGIEGALGPLVYEQISALGKDKILEAMKATPEFWQHVAPIEAKMSEFVEDFVAYGQEDEGEDGEEKK